MTGKQLKNSILQLAIQGKLVPQDANDEPASVLLQRIRKEKEELVKQGKLKKKDLVTTPISDEEKPFEIPESWEWCRLGEIVLNRDSERVPLSVSVRQQQHDKIYDYYGPGGAFDKVNAYLFDKRLLLIGEDGANLLTRTKPNAFFAEGKYWVNNHVHVLDCCVEDGIILDYIAMRINGMSLAGYVTGTAQPKMNQEKLNSIPIPFPPLSEQHRIVAKIEELMPWVEEYDKAQTQLDALNQKLPEALKKSILQEAIMGKLVPQDPNDEPASVLLQRIRKEKKQLVKDGKLKKKDLVTTPISDEEKPFEIPESWEWCRWGELSFNIQYGYNAPALPSGDIRMVRISDIQKGEVLWDTVPFCNIKDDEIESYLLGNNDILFARTGGTVGKSFLVKEVPYPSIYAGYLIRTQYNSELLVPEYLRMFMESDIYWRQLKDGTIATAQPNCNGKTLSKMVLPLPPLSEQHRIVAKIEELFDQLQAIQ